MHVSAEQQLAVDKLVAAEHTFGCFDPQGAGKTAVAINAAFRRDKFPVLITVPAHLVPQWQLQLNAWGVPDSEIASAPRGCGPFRRLEALQSDAAFCIVSYHTWANWDYVPFILDARWQAFVFDESHRLRKGKRGRRPGSTSMWEVVQLLRRKTKTKHYETPIWPLSGTPLVSNAGDIWPFLFLCNPYRYGNRERFIKDTCYTFQGDYKLEIGAVRDKEAFHSLLGRYSIRRSWRDLPALAGLGRRDIDLPVDLDPSERRRHRTIKREYYDPVTGETLDSAAAMVHALRRLSIPAKVEATTAWLEDHPGRVLLLAWYRDSAQAFAKAVAKQRPVAYIDGSTSERKRHEAIAFYKANKQSVLVGTIGTLKEGWDGLQVGYQVLMPEQHYLHTDNEQAIARILRRGQRQPVLVTNMYAPKTFDMRVRKLAAERKTNIEEALGEFLQEEEWKK